MQSVFATSSMPPPSIPFRRCDGFGQKLKINNVIVRAEGRKNLPLVSRPPQPPPTLPLKKSPTPSPPQSLPEKLSNIILSPIMAPKALFEEIWGIITGTNEAIAFFNANKLLIKGCALWTIMVFTAGVSAVIKLAMKISTEGKDEKNGLEAPFLSSSLYVGDLDFKVKDSQLHRLFMRMGRVVSVRVCRDKSTGRSLGYGYVNYSNITDARQAIETLNLVPLNGKPIRIAYSRPYHKNEAGNIIIKNLDKAIDNEALLDAFTTFGNILSCKVATDLSGQSKGYGFVLFDNEQSATSTIEKLNGTPLKGKKVYVGPYLRKHKRYSSSRFHNVYVKNLSQSTTINHLMKCFGEYGTITSCVVMRDANGKSRGFGFVNFEDPDDAARVVKVLNGYRFDDKEWYVGKAHKKYQRQMELKGRFEQTADKFQGLDLYVTNLEDSFTDDKLKELFSEFGTITLCKVMRDPNGLSRGTGFVAFSTAEEASRALAEMNGKMVARKPLHVTRREILQAQISQMLGRMSQYPLMLPRGRSRNIPFMDTGALEPSALANATPENQRKLLGEHLYPLVVDQLEHENAAKITCLLLEILDPTDVLHLMESPESLKAIVVKAMELLRFVAQQQHASLLVNDNIVS